MLDEQAEVHHVRWETAEVTPPDEPGGWWQVQVELSGAEIGPAWRAEFTRLVDETIRRQRSSAVGSLHVAEPALVVASGLDPHGDVRELKELIDGFVDTANERTREAQERAARERAEKEAEERRRHELAARLTAQFRRMD